MRGVYTVQYAISGLSAGKTLLLGQAPSNMVIEILQVKVTQSNVVTAEQLKVAISRVTTLGSPTGTSISASNVQKSEKGTTDTSVTWTANLTAEPTTYDANPLDQEGVLNVQGYRYEPPPEARDYLKPSEAFGVRLINSPTNPIDAIAEVKYREIG